MKRVTSSKIFKTVSIVLSIILLIGVVIPHPIEVTAKGKTGKVGEDFYYKGKKYTLSQYGYFGYAVDSLELVYGKYLYASGFDCPFLIYNLKTHKETQDEAHYSLGINLKPTKKWSPYHYKQYYMMSTMTGDYGLYGSYILNAKKGKIITLSRNGSPTVNRGSKVYYISSKNGNAPYYLYSCSYNGKNKRKLKKLNRKQFKVKTEWGTSYGAPYIKKVTKNYLVIADGNQLDAGHSYKYYFKTKKLKKIK